MVKIKKAKKQVNGVLLYGKVDSASNKEKTYTVIKKVIYTCDCPDFMFRSSLCKHILAVMKTEKSK